MCVLQYQQFPVLSLSPLPLPFLFMSYLSLPPPSPLSLPALSLSPPSPLSLPTLSLSPLPLPLPSFPPLLSPNPCIRREVDMMDKCLSLELTSRRGWRHSNTFWSALHPWASLCTNIATFVSDIGSKHTQYSMYQRILPNTLYVRTYVCTYIHICTLYVCMYIRMYVHIPLNCVSQNKNCTEPYVFSAAVIWCNLITTLMVAPRVVHD